MANNVGSGISTQRSVHSLSGCYLLIVVGEPSNTDHRDVMLQKISKGFLSWDLEGTGCCISAELQYLVDQEPQPEEAKNGEKLIQFVSENLVTEVLINPQLNTLQQCMKNLMNSYTKHKHIIHAGYSFTGSGSWILQDSTFSFSDFLEAFNDAEVQRLFKTYENSISIHVHCASEGDWTTSRLSQESSAKLVKAAINPTDKCSNLNGMANFVNFLGRHVVVQPLEKILEPSDVVGNIRFSRPTLYIFPGGQGDSALFGVNGFNMLIDGGFNRKACFWDFARHLDRVDAVLVTRINNNNVNGVSSFFKRKAMGQVYPKIGHVFCNIVDRKHSPDGDKDTDSLLVSLAEEGHQMMDHLRHLGLKPQNCFREPAVEAINLYHKVGHGNLDMYVLNPAKDSREVKEFLQQWHSQSSALGSSRMGVKVGNKDLLFPLPNLMSICAILVWQPADTTDSITRILFPGSSPQSKIFEGLEKLRHLSVLRAPVCSEKSLKVISTKHKPKAPFGEGKPTRLSTKAEKIIVHEGDVSPPIPKYQPSISIIGKQEKEMKIAKHEAKTLSKIQEEKKPEIVKSIKSEEKRIDIKPIQPTSTTTAAVPQQTKPEPKKFEPKKTPIAEKKPEKKKIQAVGTKHTDVPAAKPFNGTTKTVSKPSSVTSTTTSAEISVAKSAPKAKGQKEATNKKAAEEKNKATAKKSSASPAKKLSTSGESTPKPIKKIRPPQPHPQRPPTATQAVTIEKIKDNLVISSAEESIELDNQQILDSAEEEKVSVDEKQSLDEEVQGEKDKRIEEITKEMVESSHTATTNTTDEDDTMISSVVGNQLFDSIEQQEPEEVDSLEIVDVKESQPEPQPEPVTHTEPAAQVDDNYEDHYDDRLQKLETILRQYKDISSSISRLPDFNKAGDESPKQTDEKTSEQPEAVEGSHRRGSQEIQKMIEEKLNLVDDVLKISPTSESKISPKLEEGERLIKTAVKEEHEERSPPALPTDEPVIDDTTVQHEVQSQVDNKIAQEKLKLAAHDEILPEINQMKIEGSADTDKMSQKLIEDELPTTQIAEPTSTAIIKDEVHDDVIKDSQKLEIEAADSLTDKLPVSTKSDYLHSVESTVQLDKLTTSADLSKFKEDEIVDESPKLMDELKPQYETSLDNLTEKQVAHAIMEKPKPDLIEGATHVEAERQSQVDMTSSKKIKSDVDGEIKSDVDGEIKSDVEIDKTEKLAAAATDEKPKSPKVTPPLSPVAKLSDFHDLKPVELATTLMVETGIRSTSPSNILSPIPEDAPKLLKMVGESVVPPQPSKSPVPVHSEPQPFNPPIIAQTAVEYLRTPDEVADLPIHEEVPTEYDGYYHFGRKPYQETTDIYTTDPTPLVSTEEPPPPLAPAAAFAPIDTRLEVEIEDGEEPITVSRLNADHAEVIHLSDGSSPSTTPMSPRSPKDKDAKEEHNGFVKAATSKRDVDDSPVVEVPIDDSVKLHHIEDHFKPTHVIKTETKIEKDILKVEPKEEHTHELKDIEQDRRPEVQSETETIVDKRVEAVHLDAKMEIESKKDINDQINEKIVHDDQHKVEIAASKAEDIFKSKITMDETKDIVSETQLKEDTILASHIDDKTDTKTPFEHEKIIKSQIKGEIMVEVKTRVETVPDIPMKEKQVIHTQLKEETAFESHINDEKVMDCAIKVTDSHVTDESILENYIKDERVLHSQDKEEKVLESHIKDKTIIESGVTHEKVLDSQIKSESILESHQLEDKKVLESEIKHETVLESAIKDEKVLPSQIKEEKFLESHIKDEIVLESGVTHETVLDSAIKSESFLESHQVDEKVVDNQVKHETVLQSQIKEDNFLESHIKGETVLQSHVEDEKNFESQIKAESIKESRAEKFLESQIKDEKVLESQIKNEKVLESQIKDEKVLESKSKIEMVESYIKDEKVLDSHSKEEQLLKSQFMDDKETHKAVESHEDEKIIAESHIKDEKEEVEVKHEQVKIKEVTDDVKFKDEKAEVHVEDVKHEVKVMEEKDEVKVMEEKDEVKVKDETISDSLTRSKIVPGSVSETDESESKHVDVPQMKISADVENFDATSIVITHDKLPESQINVEVHKDVQSKESEELKQSEADDLKIETAVEKSAEIHSHVKTEAVPEKHEDKSEFKDEIKQTLTKESQQETKPVEIYVTEATSSAKVKSEGEMKDEKIDYGSSHQKTAVTDDKLGDTGAIKKEDHDRDNKKLEDIVSKEKLEESHSKDIKMETTLIHYESRLDEELEKLKAEETKREEKSSEFIKQLEETSIKSVTESPVRSAKNEEAEKPKEIALEKEDTHKIQITKSKDDDGEMKVKSAEEKTSISSQMKVDQFGQGQVQETISSKAKLTETKVDDVVGKTDETPTKDIHTSKTEDKVGGEDKPEVKKETKEMSIPLSITSKTDLPKEQPKPSSPPRPHYEEPWSSLHAQMMAQSEQATDPHRIDHIWASDKQIKPPEATLSAEKWSGGDDDAILGHHKTPDLRGSSPEMDTTTVTNPFDIDPMTQSFYDFTTSTSSSRLAKADEVPFHNEKDVDEFASTHPKIRTVHEDIKQPDLVDSHTGIEKLIDSHMTPPLTATTTVMPDVFSHQKPSFVVEHDKEYEGYYEVHHPKEEPFEFIPPRPEYGDPIPPIKHDLDILSHVHETVPSDQEDEMIISKLSQKEASSYDEKDREDVRSHEATPYQRQSPTLPPMYTKTYLADDDDDHLQIAMGRERAETFIGEDSSHPPLVVPIRKISPMEQSYHSDYDQPNLFGYEMEQEEDEIPQPIHRPRSSSGEEEQPYQQEQEMLLNRTIPDVAHSPMYISADDDTEEEYKAPGYQDDQRSSDVEYESPYHKPIVSTAMPQFVKSYPRPDDLTSDESDVEMGQHGHEISSRTGHHLHRVLPGGRGAQSEKWELYDKEANNLQQEEVVDNESFINKEMYEDSESHEIQGEERYSPICTPEYGGSPSYTRERSSTSTETDVEEEEDDDEEKEMADKLGYSHREGSDKDSPELHRKPQPFAAKEMHRRGVEGAESPFPTSTGSGAVSLSSPGDDLSSSASIQDDKKPGGKPVSRNPFEEWGEPMGLPSPPPPPPSDQSDKLPKSKSESKTAMSNVSLKKQPSKKVENNGMSMDNKDNKGNNDNVSQQINGKSILGGDEMKKNKKSQVTQSPKRNPISVSGPKSSPIKTKRPESPLSVSDGHRKSTSTTNKPSVPPVYVDLTYIPHHGNPFYADVEFFRMVRARYYVFSGTNPSKEVFNALLEAKQSWEDPDLEVTIIPTYDTDTLGYWFAVNEELLSKHKIDLAPSASRCTINLQDHETSCSAYRLEF